MVVISLTSTYALLVLALIGQICISQQQHLGAVLAGFAQHKMVAMTHLNFWIKFFNISQIFIQVALISTVNGVGACIYTYMQFLPTVPWLIAVTSFLWTQSHGMWHMVVVIAIIR